MSRFHDDSTVASHPVGVRLDRAKLDKLHPRGLISRLVDRLRSFEDALDEHMQLGDSRAAVVLSTEPLRIAAYTDELDCSCVLEFADGVAARILAMAPDLQAGAHLLTVNTYQSEPFTVNDLWHGPRSHHRYVNFYPVIADFYSSDTLAIESRKAAIRGLEWSRCAEAAYEYLQKTSGKCRNGSPWDSLAPVGRF